MGLSLQPQKCYLASAWRWTLFQALSKELTGTEDNHLLIHQAVTSFMVMQENEVILALYCHVESMARHVTQKRINKDGWGTEVEIHVRAIIL